MSNDTSTLDVDPARFDEAVRALRTAEGRVAPAAKSFTPREHRKAVKLSKTLRTAVSLSTQRNGEVHAIWQFADAYTTAHGLRSIPPNWRIVRSCWSYLPAVDTYKSRLGEDRTRPALLASRIDRSKFDGAALRRLRAERGVGPSRQLKYGRAA